MRLQRRFLSVIVPVIALALLTLGWLAYVQLRRGAEDELSRQMLVALDRIEQQSLSWVDATETNVDLFASAAAIENYFDLPEAQRENSPAAAPAKALFEKLRRSVPEYREIRLLNRDGHEELRVADADLVNRSEVERGTPWFDAVALNWGLPIHTSVMNHPDDGRISLVVAKPVRRPVSRADGRTGPAVLKGYLVVAARLDFLREEMQRFAAGRGAFMSLLDSSGTPLMTSIPDATEVTLDGHRSLVAGRRLFDDLRLVAIVPEEALDADVGRLAASVAGVTAAAIVLASLLSLLLLRSVVLAPITRLRESAVAIGRGRLDTIIEVRRDDEIGDLATAFGEMTGRLSESMRELHRSHAKIERLAYRDSLSGLPNRRAFLDLVERSIVAAERRGGRLAVLFLDLDDFKRLNDSEGHAAGDRLLREVGDRLRRCVGMPTDEPWARADGASASDDFGARRIEDPTANRVARFGGDEFVVLLGDVGGRAEVRGVAENVLSALTEPVAFDGRARTVGTSIGIASYPEDATDVDGMLTCADTAMYAAKQGGRNTHRFFERAMREEIEARLLLEAELSRAIANGGLELHYQPQVHARSGELAGVEALVRWEHAERGGIGPDRFIPVAEETGLIAALGDWVLDEGCRQWRRWHDAGVAPPRVAINVSRRQFALGDLERVVAAVLERHAMPAHALELEITESCIMEGADAVIRTLARIRATGVHVAMDDFGTGHSSLGALATLPIDTLKIDRCFVSGVEPGSPSDRIVSAILELGAGLGLGVVAEGVETAAELAYLDERRCDVVQGYLLGRPVPAEAMTAHLHDVLGGVERAA